MKQLVLLLEHRIEIPENIPDACLVGRWPKGGGYYEEIEAHEVDTLEVGDRVSLDEMEFESDPEDDGFIVFSLAGYRIEEVDDER